MDWHPEYQLIIDWHPEYQFIMDWHPEYQLIMDWHPEYQLIMGWHPEYQLILNCFGYGGCIPFNVPILFVKLFFMFGYTSRINNA